MTDDQDFKAEMEYERMIEAKQEAREIALGQWISDNLEYLRKEFCSNNDDFKRFCKDAFNSDAE